MAAASQSENISEPFNTRLNRMTNREVNNVLRHIHNRPLINYNRKSGNVYHKVTRTTKGYHGYQRKTNMNATKKKNMIRTFYKKIMKNEAIRQSLPTKVYTFIIRGNNLFAKSRIEIQQEMDMGQITVYAMPVTNQQELWARHVNLEELTRRFDDQTTPVWAGGEYTIAADGKLRFNLHSGNYVHMRMAELINEYKHVPKTSHAIGRVNVRDEMLNSMRRKMMEVFSIIGISSELNYNANEANSLMGYQLLTRKQTWNNLENENRNLVGEYYNRINKNQINQYLAAINENKRRIAWEKQASIRKVSNQSSNIIR